MPSCVIFKEYEKSRAFDIVSAIEEQDYGLSICEWGMKGFASIAGLAMNAQNTESLADFMDDGGCEAIISIMSKYAESSQVISAYGCLAISILVWSLREFKEFFGELGGCEIIVFAMSMHIGDGEVSEYGSRAIAYLAKQNISNSYRLSDAGACDVLAQVGNFGFSLRHPKCITIATNVCYAFVQLSEALNAKRLFDCGISSLIGELMKLHYKNEEFAIAGMEIICALASLNAIHREELGKVGICHQVIQMLELYNKNNAIVLEGCEAIMHLSLSPNNAYLLGEENACALICKMLFHKLMNVDFGAEVCTGAMLNLATYGITALPNRQRLVDANGIEILRQTQFCPKASYKARENVTALLALLEPNTSSTNNAANHSHANNHSHHHASSASTQSTQASSSNLLSVIYGSEVKGNTVPLQVEVREVIEYHSILSPKDRINSPSPEDDTDESSSVGLEELLIGGSPSIMNGKHANNGLHGVVEL